MSNWRAIAARALRGLAGRPEFTFPLGWKGRLGNQLFQMAGTYALARQEGVGVRFRRDWPYRPFFDLPEEWFAPRAITARCGTALDLATLIPIEHRVYLQDVRLWDGLVEDVRSLFQPGIRARRQAAGLRPDLAAIPHRTAVHVRRGFAVEYGAHQTLPMAYYEQALDEIRSEHPGTVPVVFSDDPPWCRKHLPIEGAVIVEGSPDWADLILMADCECHITANSTFSWWAAFLSGDDRPIVPWLTGVLPETFRRVNFSHWREIELAP